MIHSYNDLCYLKVSDGGTVNLLSRSCGIYNINELGLQKRSSWSVDEIDGKEKTYRCASHEMRIFGSIGSGASSVVQRAIHIPSHRILALKKINIFEKVCESLFCFFLLCGGQFYYCFDKAEEVYSLLYSRYFEMHSTQ